MAGNPKGGASRFAYNPQALAAFIEDKTEYVRTVVPTTRKGRPTQQNIKLRYVNGKHFDQTSDARVLLRWRTKAKGVTLHGAARLLNNYGLTLEEFEAWAKSAGLRPILWGERSTTQGGVK